MLDTILGAWAPLIKRRYKSLFPLGVDNPAGWEWGAGNTLSDISGLREPESVLGNEQLNRMGGVSGMDTLFLNKGVWSSPDKVTSE